MTDLQQSYHVEGPSGTLEALLTMPATQAVKELAVVCHPHPLYGGTMTNKVVHTLAKTFTDWGYASLRFNFRGVGQSQGTYDEGIGETQDVVAVVQWAQQTLGLPTSILAGFSFGAYVALKASQLLPDLRLLITVAPPIAKLPVEACAVPPCPWWVVQGGLDELIDAKAVVDWASAQQPPPTLLTIPEATHFFHGQLTELRKILTQAYHALYIPTVSSQNR